MIPIVIAIAVVIFSLMHFVPGDPAKIILGNTATADELAAKREALGLNRPFFVQLADYLSQFFFKGNMGTSYTTTAPITPQVLQRIPRTVALGLGSMEIGRAHV